MHYVIKIKNKYLKIKGTAKMRLLQYMNYIYLHEKEMLIEIYAETNVLCII